MKIDKLIEKLEDVKEEHGNLSIYPNFKYSTILDNVLEVLNYEPFMNNTIKQAISKLERVKQKEGNIDLEWKITVKAIPEYKKQIIEITNLQ